MRVLLLAQWYPPVIGGEENHVRSLARGLVERGHDVTVATLRQPGTAEREDDSGVRVERLRGWAQRIAPLFSQTERRSAQPFPDPETSGRLYDLARRFRPDVVHAHNWMIHAYLPMKSIIGAPLALTLHDYSLVCAKKNLVRLKPDGTEPCTGPGFEKCLRCAGRHYGTAKGTVTTVGMWLSTAAERRLVDVFLPVSHAVARWSGLASSGLPWEVVPNFIDEGAARLWDEEHAELLPREPFVLYVGSFSRPKGVDVLLDAYRSANITMALVLIGYRTSESGGWRSDVARKVYVFEDWTRPAVMTAWRRAEYGVVPSVWRDPCPTVAMEAMLVGRPVIASGIGGLPEIVQDGGSGLLVEPGDAPQLANAMRLLSDDSSLRSRLAAGAAARAGQFTARAVIPRIESAYECVVTRGVG